jgi:hypothetical protein
MLTGIGAWHLFLLKEDNDLDFLREKTRTGRPYGRDLLRKGGTPERQGLAPGEARTESL